MRKVIEGVNKAQAPAGVTVEDWNASVKNYFGEYFRRKSLLNTKRELLRSELINLAKIQPFREYTDLLSRLVKMYRSEIRKDPSNAYAFLNLLFMGTVVADEKWMSLYLTHEPLPKSASLYDRIYKNFDLLDAILEGSYKHHFRLMYGFAVKSAGGTFPTNLTSADFGALVSQFPISIAPTVALLLKDPEHQIQINQWRNIAAHKSFMLKTSRTLEIEYGRTTQRIKRLTPASVDRVLNWATRALTTLRLCNVIIYIEYMRELKAAGLQDPPIRLESFLTGLCHNLATVGFHCVSSVGQNRTFTLIIREQLNRPVLDAIIHASQALDQVSVALDSDPTRRSRFDKASVQLVDENNYVLADASVEINVALALTLGKIRQKKYINSVNFKIAN